MEATELVSRIGKTKYEGSSVKAGVPYQNIPSLNLSGHRDKSDWRGARICELVDVKGKTVLDLGCSVGTMSYALKKNGAKSVKGIDHDEDSLDLGRFIYGKDIELVQADITTKLLDFDHVDIVVWTSQFMWMVKQHGMDYALDFLFALSQKCDVLIFETAGKQDGLAPLNMNQEELLPMLIQNSCFQSITDTGPWGDGWAPRNVFVCKNPKMTWDSNFYSMVERLDRKTIKKTFRCGSKAPSLSASRALELKERELMFLTLFKGWDHFPQVLSSSANSIDMAYSGIPATWIPDSDLVAMTKALSSKEVVHRDIRPENILWNGKNCVLIDFSYAVNHGDITNYHYDLGATYKCPSGFNDEFSLRKSQFKLMEAQCRK